MDLILWRHAEAAEGEVDLVRELTRRGEHQARDMAAWLAPRLPAGARVFTSEARRSRQTARYLERPAQILPELNPDQPWQRVWEALDWPQCGETLVVVGHQPWLGQIASRLLCGEAQYWTVKKSGLWWFGHRTRHGDARTILRGMQTPALLESSGH